jgi:heme/copper-type cytochrome/quinol oxidase subunit 4
MIYFSGALVAVAVALVALRLAERRSEKRWLVLHIIVGIVVLAVSISSMIQIYRIGDAGAQSVWGGELARLQKPKT